MFKLDVGGDRQKIFCLSLDTVKQSGTFRPLVFDCVFKVLQILFDKFKSSIVDSMCNLLMAVFCGKFAEALDLHEKGKLEIPGGWGCSKTLRNGNSRGVGGSKVKNLPWGVWIFSGTTQCT